MKSAYGLMEETKKPTWQELQTVSTVGTPEMGTSLWLGVIRRAPQVGKEGTIQVWTAHVFMELQAGWGMKRKREVYTEHLYCGRRWIEKVSVP